MNTESLRVAVDENVVDFRTLTPSSPAEPRSVDAADWRRFEKHVAEILTAFGLDLETPGTRDTPRRFLRALFDSTSGYDGDPKLHTAFPSEAAEALEVPGQIVEGPISFVCLCEHHALPFHGAAHVAYIPGGEIIGISKLTRLVRLFSRRFTVQERLGEQIADTLAELIAPRGIALHLRASHLCTQMRGVEEHSQTVTTFWRGAYRDASLRAEFLQQVGAHSR